MLELYLPILVFLILGALFGAVPILFGSLLGAKKPNKEKNSPFECGFAPFEDARLKFDVRFYLVAILFIVFDLEIAFLFPWAIIIKELSCKALCAMAIFIVILLIGFIYEWKKGALEWE